MKTNQELHKEVNERYAKKHKAKHLKFQGIKSVAKNKALAKKIGKQVVIPSNRKNWTEEQRREAYEQDSD